MKRFEITYWKLPKDDGPAKQVGGEVREFASREAANRFARRAAGPHAWCTMELGIEVL